MSVCETNLLRGKGVEFIFKNGLIFFSHLPVLLLSIILQPYSEPDQS